jgi:hypothetical protein
MGRMSCQEDIETRHVDAWHHERWLQDERRDAPRAERHGRRQAPASEEEEARKASSDKRAAFGEASQDLAKASYEQDARPATAAD